MYTYQLQFSNGNKSEMTVKNLDACHLKAIPQLKEEGDKVTIYHNGKIVSTVKLTTGAWHPVHDGCHFNR